MNYIEVHIECPEELLEVLIAEMDYIGADSICEEEKGLFVSFIEDTFEVNELTDICHRYKVTFTHQKADKKNWNEEWEKNFNPLIIKNCSVRASFHSKPENVDYDIVINPKMSFGTGHHSTTTLMVERLLQTDLKGKSLMDMGTGTGILAILGEKLGAQPIFGIDIDDWSVENSIENIEINHCKHISIYKGGAEQLANFGGFDVFLANINRNILLEDMAYYEKHINSNGILLLSGFYTEDVEVLEQKCNGLNLEKTFQNSNNNWTVLEFRRK